MRKIIFYSHTLRSVERSVNQKAAFAQQIPLAGARVPRVLVNHVAHA